MSERDYSLSALTDEYRAILWPQLRSARKGRHFSWEAVERGLHAHASWTEGGAQELANLARSYGVFMLRNALALAFALDIEDGELGL